MRRRVALALLLALGIGAAPLLAQDAARAPLVGVLRINTPAGNVYLATVFREALAALGQVEGRNLRIDYRLAAGDADRFPALAEALVGEKASVIVTFGEAATRAAQSATGTIPIVAVADDLVASGLIASLARPGGNTTGVSILAPELDAKRLEILKEILPTARRVGVLNDPAGSSPTRLQSITETARALGLELLIRDIASPAEIGPALAALRAEGADGVDILSSPMLSAAEQELGRISVEHGLPAICQFREMAEAGCLASYGGRRVDMYRMLAEYTDKMLRGARPGETLAQQPSAVELVVNRRVARTLGIEIPAKFLAGADEVIE